MAKQQLDKSNLGYLGIDFQYKLAKVFVEEPKFFEDSVQIIEQNAFTSSAKVERELREYEELNDPICQFLEDVEQDQIYNHETKEVHLRYQVFCQQLQVYPVGLPQFSREITQRLACSIKDKRINGQRCRIFVKN